MNLLRTVNPKNKTASYFYQQKWVYLGIKNRNSGLASWGKTIGESRDQRRVLLFYRGKGEVGKIFINKKSNGVNSELEV